MRVALADDVVLFREGLAALLRELGIEVCHQAANEEELLEGIAANPPDVAIVDIRLTNGPEADGLRAAKTLRARHPDIGILLLSAYAEPAYALRLLEGEATGVGYLIKDRVGRVEILQDALQRIDSGEIVIDSELVAQMMERPSRRQSLELLSAQELHVLQHIAEGRSNNGIAEALHLSPKTVEKYILNIFKKLKLEQQEQDNRRILAALHWLQR